MSFVTFVNHTVIRIVLLILLKTQVMQVFTIAVEV